jgi:hypothetical protein
MGSPSLPVVFGQAGDETPKEYAQAALLGWAALVFVFIFFLVYMLHFVLDVM